ncbi:MAG: ABC transporter permease [Halanaerobiales bacterium]|nr:ABC transporter permease [Halanaerobiales bacterium]
MFLIKLALKNLTRHKRRTLITASVIALGLFMYIYIDSMMIGMINLSFDNIIDLEAGHLEIVNSQYWEEKNELPLSNLIGIEDNLISEVKKTPYIKGMLPRLKFKASLNNGIDELPIIVWAVDSDLERNVLTTSEHLVEGSMPQKGKMEAVIGKDLAELMDLQVGDFITLVVKTKNGDYNTIDPVITGLLQTSHPAINDSIVYVPLEIAQKALNVENQVSEIVIRLEDAKYTKTAGVELSNLLNQRPELEVETWKDLSQDIIAMNEAQNMENQFIISIILIIAAVGIINVIILSALERLEEIGMMKAMGMREREIIFSFMIESVGIGILGGIMGCFLGAIGVITLKKYGIDLAWFGFDGMDYGLPLSGVFYGEWNLPVFIFVFNFGVVVSFLSSILPARWAARKNPIDAIYHR